MRAAEEAAFGEFVSARRRSLLRTAFLLSGDWHLAEDLVQVSLAKLYVAWPRVRRRDEVDGFARRTVVNAFLDEKRRPWRREQSTDRVPERPVVAAEAGDPVLRQRLGAALAEMPPRQRAVLVLRFWEDQSVEQTASLLGCSGGTVKSQTARGLERLRGVLGPDFMAATRSDS